MDDKIHAVMSTADGPVHDFENMRMAGARFRVVDLSGARFDQVNLHDVVMRGVELANVDISGEIWNVNINGVDIGPLVEAELDRRDPNRVKMRPTDADGFREAWGLVEHLWADTVARARRLDPALLHESVDGEWSFIQTLRHLVFATDSWIRRVILGDPNPWDPLDLPFDQMKETPGVPWDRAARPSLDDVLAIRADRMRSMRQVLNDLTDEILDSHTVPVTAPGWPPAKSYPVAEVLRIILNEEWHHRLFAERDLAQLELR